MPVAMQERTFRPVSRSAPTITLCYADILAVHFAGKRVLRMHFGHADENAFLISLLYERSSTDPDVGTRDERHPIVNVWWKCQAAHDYSANTTLADVSTLTEAQAFFSRLMVDEHLYVQAYRDLLQSLDAGSPLVVQDRNFLDYYFPVSQGDAIMAVCFDLDVLSANGLKTPRHG